MAAVQALAQAARAWLWQAAANKLQAAQRASQPACLSVSLHDAVLCLSSHRVLRRVLAQRPPSLPLHRACTAQWQLTSCLPA